MPQLGCKRQGNQIKLLPFREAKVIITSAKTFLSYRDVETSKAAVEQMIAHIKVPLLIVYDRADNIQGHYHSTGNHRRPDQRKCGQLP